MRHVYTCIRLSSCVLPGSPPENCVLLIFFYLYFQIFLQFQNLNKHVYICLYIYLCFNDIVLVTDI